MPELTITGWQESKQKLRSPLYSLFKNQCYWFSNFIYEAAKFLDEKVSPRLDRLNDRHQPLPRGQMENLSSIETDEFFMPFYLYKPQVAGRWFSFKISEVEEVVLSHIIQKSVEQQLNKHMAFQLFSHTGQASNKKYQMNNWQNKVM